MNKGKMCEIYDEEKCVKPPDGDKMWEKFDAFCHLPIDYFHLHQKVDTTPDPIWDRPNFGSGQLACLIYRLWNAVCKKPRWDIMDSSRASLHSAIMGSSASMRTVYNYLQGYVSRNLQKMSRESISCLVIAQSEAVLYKCCFLKVITWPWKWGQTKKWTFSKPDIWGIYQRGLQDLLKPGEFLDYRDLDLDKICQQMCSKPLTK
jgi:hypothetical protein